jgi:streptomycin 6-kinase
VGTLGPDLLERSHRAAIRLCSTQIDVVLLHGDFLDKNLILGPAGFVAIDPIPSIGDPCSDIGFFAASHPPAGLITSRARGLAERLGRDPVRAQRWAAIWTIGEACETWRSDFDELERWVRTEGVRLLHHNERD